MAVLNSCCCLNNIPSSNPSSISPSQTSKPSQISWERNDKDWRKQCFVGMMACVIINGSSITAEAAVGREGNWAGIAGDFQVMSVVEAKKMTGLKWSERRACPPWQINSLETIVPENLPRPFKSRISESIRLPSNTSNPTVRPTVKANPNCFSM